MAINSRQKGARGERQWRDELRAQGYEARRGQQFSGSPDSPDVVCRDLGWIHFEVKAVERLNIEEAMRQAQRDCGFRITDCGFQKVPIVAHRRKFCPWLVTMTAETFFKLLRGDYLTAQKAKGAPGADQMNFGWGDGAEKTGSRSPQTSPQGGEGEKTSKILGTPDAAPATENK